MVISYNGYEPTYKGLKRGIDDDYSRIPLRYEPTYKGLKPRDRQDMRYSQAQLRAYL